MWKFNSLCIFLVMGVVVGLPQNSNLASLVDEVFGNPNSQNNNVLKTTVRPVDKSDTALIAEIFGQTEKKNGQDANKKQGNDKINVKNQGDTFLGIDNEKRNNDDCECVPYYQCRNGTIIDNGIGLIDIRIQGVCDDYLHICCKIPEIIRSPEGKITPRPVVRRGCGQRHPEGVGFRISGDQNNEAQFGEFPWMVAILRQEDVNGQKLNVYQCGGSLIHPSVVLTAGHCVVGKTPQQLKIRAGEWDTQTKNEVFPHQDRDVANFVVHENYRAGPLHNDYALLFLSQAVEISENVDVVCLPGVNDVFDGSRCFASGWGKDVFGKEGHYQVILKRVELPVMNSQTCQSSLRTTRLGKYFVLDKSFICAGGENGKDTCGGDGGSPLVCPLRSDPNRYAQAGIVAWGVGCGQDGIPGVYANVAAVRFWIDQQLAHNNYDTSTYGS